MPYKPAKVTPTMSQNQPKDAIMDEDAKLPNTRTPGTVPRKGTSMTEGGDGSWGMRHRDKIKD